MAAPSPEEIAAGVPAQANIVQRVAAPGGGQYLVGADGGVFAVGGARFAGSIPGLQGDTLAGQHTIGANGFGLDADQGGYTLTDAAGHHYDFRFQQPQAPPPNPLYQDPSFQAFIRTSGLGYDQAVRDYETNVALAQRAQTAALGELNDPYGARALDRQALLQGNVNSGRAGGAVQDQLTGYDTQTANQASKANQTYADAVSGYGQDFSKTVGGITQKATEQGINTGSDQAWQKFLQTEAQKYPDMADKIMGSGNPSGTGNGGV